MAENKNDGYRVKEYAGPVKRYVQFLEIKDSPELIARYVECHDKDHAWKEIRDGIREVGILEMELYIIGNKVVMIVETPLDFDWSESMSRLATLPRQAEWERFVSMMQGCDPDASSDEKWRLMERMFYLYD